MKIQLETDARYTIVS